MIGFHEAIRRLYQRFFHPHRVRELRKRGANIGRGVRMYHDVVIDPDHCWHVTIQDDVVLAPRVYILAHDASTKGLLGYARVGKVTIGSHVFIGAGTLVLPGVTVGDNVIIGAGSVVTKDVPPGHVAAGNPARVLCSIEEFTEKHRRRMKDLPCFGEEYSLRRGVTTEMKREMNDKMKDGLGYLV